MAVLLYARPPLDAAEERTIRKLAGARHAPGDWIRRARMITGSWDGWAPPRSPTSWAATPRRCGSGCTGSTPRASTGWATGRPGRPRRITETERGRIIALARSPPPGRLVQGGEGLLPPAEPEAPAHWTLDTLAEAAQAEGIQVGRSQVRRILLAEGARWRRTRSWTTSTDPEFAPKERRSSPSTPPAAGGDRGLRRRARPGDPAQLPARARLDRRRPPGQGAAGLRPRAGEDLGVRRAPRP